MIAAVAYTVTVLVLVAYGARARHRGADGSRPPHDRLRLTRRERAAWRTFTRRFGRDLRHQLAVAWLEEHIERTERRLREHLSESGDA